jgi:hypothetical protein
VPEKKFPSKLKSVKSTTIAQININGKLDYFDEEEIVLTGVCCHLLSFLEDFCIDKRRDISFEVILMYPVVCR